MARTKRNLSAEFKTKVVLEVIAGMKTINDIASEHSLQPNMEVYLTSYSNIREIGVI